MLLPALLHRPWWTRLNLIHRAGVLALFLPHDPDRGTGRLVDHDAHRRQFGSAQARRVHSPGRSERSRPRRSDALARPVALAMPHCEGQECETRLSSIESQADPIASAARLEPVGDLDGIFGYRAIETPRRRIAQRRVRGGPADRRPRRQDHRSTPARARADPARIRKAATPTLLGPQVQPLALALPAPATSP